MRYATADMSIYRLLCKSWHASDVSTQFPSAAASNTAAIVASSHAIDIVKGYYGNLHIEELMELMDEVRDEDKDVNEIQGNGDMSAVK